LHTGIAQALIPEAIDAQDQLLATEAGNTVPKIMEPSPPTVEHSTSNIKPAKKERKSKPDRTEPRHDYSKLRVLVAEDNKVNQQVITRMLKLEQILQVTIAEDGQQALDLVRTSSLSPSSTVENSFAFQPSVTNDRVGDAEPYDLIFMDIQMPNMDGITACKLIREFGFQQPIVALTAFAEKSNQEDCTNAGMDHFLAKPLQRPKLKDVLQKFCRSDAGKRE
jgi:osomolarity two-component system sensor histidine kinase SLN1